MCIRDRYQRRVQGVSLRRYITELRGANARSVMGKEREKTSCCSGIGLSKPRLYSVTPVPLPNECEEKLSTCCVLDETILANKLPVIRDKKEALSIEIPLKVKSNNFYNELSEFLKRDQIRVRRLLMS
eukprot:TRINITY_DN1168_c0_g2_i1.p1 TRINITY_DN1168_c0_g2~~TRINITY_DN1168_c0_g2_i1.p1  ORF type:complete len:128 (+),score=17.94 TRINITY_DN1168_c0_g2_i1:73-456(+)